MRGLSTWAFTAELGLSQKRLIAIEQDTTEQVAGLFDLTNEQLNTIISWSPRPLTGVRMQFRNEEVVSRARGKSDGSRLPCLPARRSRPSPIYHSRQHGDAGGMAAEARYDLYQTQNSIGAALDRKSCAAEI